MSTSVGPTHLARLLRLPEPSPEQAAVISAPLGPLAVIVGRLGQSETMTARLVWLVANGMAQIVAAYDRPMDEITWILQTVAAAVLELAGDLSKHLRDTSDVIALGCG